MATLYCYKLENGVLSEMAIEAKETPLGYCIEKEEDYFFFGYKRRVLKTGLGRIVSDYSAKRIVFDHENREAAIDLLFEDAERNLKRYLKKVREQEQLLKYLESAKTEETRAGGC